MRTITQRSAANGNPLDLFLAGIFGSDNLDVVARAIAYAPPGGGGGGGCATAGFLALGTSEGGSQNKFMDGWCLHGEEGVKLGSQNCIEGGEDQVIITMSDITASYGSGGYDFGSDNEMVPEELCDDGTYDNNDLPDIVEDATLGDYFDLSGGFIFDLSQPAGHPSHVTAVRNAIDEVEFPPGWTVVNSGDDIDIDSNTSNMVFVSDKNVKVGSDVVLTNVLMFAQEKVTTGSNVFMNNVYLLAKDNVEIGSNVTIGEDTYCSTPTGDINLILGANQIKMGSNVPMTNVQMIAGNYVDWGSDDIAVGAVSVLSGGSLKFGSTWETRGCGGANLYFDWSQNVSDEPMRLVR